MMQTHKGLVPTSVSWLDQTQQEQCESPLIKSPGLTRELLSIAENFAKQHATAGSSLKAGEIWSYAMSTAQASIHKPFTAKLESCHVEIGPKAHLRHGASADIVIVAAIECPLKDSIGAMNCEIQFADPRGPMVASYIQPQLSQLAQFGDYVYMNFTQGSVLVFPGWLDFRYHLERPQKLAVFHISLVSSTSTASNETKVLRQEIEDLSTKNQRLEEKLRKARALLKEMNGIFD